MNGDALASKAGSEPAEKAPEEAVRSRAGWAWTGVGYVFFLIGLLGLALPVLPTTIFWIAAAACFAKSCPAMQKRIFAWPVVGQPVEDFLEHGVIRAKSKRAAYLGMLLAAVIVAMLSASLTVTLVSIGLILTGAVYVMTRPSATPAEQRS